ncbi:hypothetical protein G3480_27015 [Thiorhodococcus mannitoliphagus]|uniref:Uncharacterized protein n=1 Tax=Thiorhodococcus mannitoliphagus TaxID=329406 RepID=A0A6P1E096_9GAMM|nr:hypothetical protein [Thiorhodococcus mannitoliphagus]NEX23858.1 hypothetical protein [Thiorhodococcus mannitoliphagus]
METNSTSVLALEDPGAMGDATEDAESTRRSSLAPASHSRALAGLFEPGRNCWRVAHAARLGVLVDGEDYYRAVRKSMIKARRRIYIAGWDLHSQLELVRGPVDDDLPTQLADLLIALLERNPALDVYSGPRKLDTDLSYRLAH